MKYKNKKDYQTYILLAPWLIVFILFWLYPLCYAVFLSLTNYTTLNGTTEFIGLKNYSKIFTDEIFWKALLNTTIFTFGSVPVTVTVSIFLAVMVNSRIVRFKEFFKASYFLPSVTSLVVISLIFTNLYTKDGYINLLLKFSGLPQSKLGFLQEPGTALISIMAMDIWSSVGYYMVIFLAGMQAIPEDLYESARISGANAWQRFLWITLPLLRQTILFVLVINVIKSFQIFIEIFVMTKGGPIGATTTLVYQVFVNAFEKSDMFGYAAALAYIVFFILMIFSLIQIKILKVKA